MESAKSVKFANGRAFQLELQRRVEEFFLATSRRRQRDCGSMYVKTAILLAVFSVRYWFLAPARARTSAMTIAASYIVGGLVPLAPYFVLRSMGAALAASVVATVFALLAFGYVKGTFTGKRPFRSAWQTAVVGGLAAAAAFAIAKLIA